MSDGKCADIEQHSRHEKCSEPDIDSLSPLHYPPKITGHVSGSQQLASYCVDQYFHHLRVQTSLDGMPGPRDQS